MTGDWMVSILYDGKHIEGSPFNVRVYDPGQIRVIGLDAGLASRNYTFTGQFCFRSLLINCLDTRLFSKVYY